MGETVLSASQIVSFPILKLLIGFSNNLPQVYVQSASYNQFGSRSSHR